MDLDQPAFPKQGEEIVPAEGPQPTKVEEENPVTPPTLGGEPEVPQPEEQRIPYLRFKETVDRARQAERVAEEAQERLEQLMNERSVRPEESYIAGPYKGELPGYWLGMYGDNDNSRAAYAYELERQKSIRDEVRRETLQAVREERTKETKVFSQNERLIDNRLEDFSESLGRPLSEQEEDAILDIVDDYTPKDEEGNYSGDMISMEKAWQIYSFQQTQNSSKIQKSRKTPTALTSTRTDGQPSNKETDNKNWNPDDWNSWRKRIPN